MNDKDIEQEIQAKGLTAPRVTPQSIEAKVVHEEFMQPVGTLTLCVLGLCNGTYVVGESACVSAANFDPVIGRKIARQKAIDKIWALEGYLLAERMASAPKGGAT